MLLKKNQVRNLTLQGSPENWRACYILNSVPSAVSLFCRVFGSLLSPGGWQARSYYWKVTQQISMSHQNTCIQMLIHLFYSLDVVCLQIETGRFYPHWKL